MNKYKDSLYPDKINDFIDNEGNLSEEAKELVKEAAGGEGSSITVKDGKLIVDEVVMPAGPVPVATIDGVDYFHKHEFDLETVYNTLGVNNRMSLLTGERTDKDSSLRVISLGTNRLLLHLNESGANFTLYPTAYYTSQAFTVVSSVEEVTDNTKICLNNANIVAYYGFLSEDGKTFISYWNEEGDVPAEAAPVTKIKDANNNEVEVHDARLVVTSADIGKVVGVNDNGKLALLPAPNGGTKLYKHDVLLDITTESGSGQVRCYVITDSSDSFRNITGGGPNRIGSDGNIVSIYGSVGMFVGSFYDDKCIDVDGDLNNDGTIRVFTSTAFNSDTVTAL